MSKKEAIGFTSLGLPHLNIHRSINHYDFTKASRRILVVGSMGSGKTEYSARIWRDARVALKKSDSFAELTIGRKADADAYTSTSTLEKENAESVQETEVADRRKVFFIRSFLDRNRFVGYPTDSLAYRGGYERLGDSIATIRNSFELEDVINANPQAGTWIIDEASFYDERIAYLSKHLSETRGLSFVFPTLILNFRNEIFNETARLLLDQATDVFPLSAYCEHRDCMADSYFSYRYYRINGKECPALYFDPLIIVGGDSEKDNPLEPNYCTRCEKHHHLPGKEYTFLVLKPLGAEAAVGNSAPLVRELHALKHDTEKSLLSKHIELEKQAILAQRKSKNGEMEEEDKALLIESALLLPNIAEKALIYLFMEQNLISETLLVDISHKLELDSDYIRDRIQDGGRSIVP